jgi:hypothetical protein
MKATTTGRSGRGKIAAAFAVIVALTAGFFAFAPSAFAHHPQISGDAECEENGTFTVNWTVGNSETLSNRYMLVQAYSVTPDVGTTSGLTADGTYDGIVGPAYGGPGTVIPPTGEVTATTSGIPGDTQSITLQVTGRWKYQSNNNVTTVTETRSFTVELGGDCTPPKGSLSISKVVTGNSAPPGATYTVNYDNGAGTSGSVTVQGGETETVDNLPFGSYTLSEVNAPPGATISPNPAVVGANSSHVDVTVTNPYPNVGSFSVTKQVTGATGGYVPGSEFAVSYDCDNGASGTLLLENGDTEVVGDLPIGTVCTLDETGKPSTSGPSYVYGPEVFSPSNVVIIVENDENVVQVTLTNPIDQLVGSLSVTKNLSGAVEGYVEASTFGFTLDCPGTEFDESFTLEAGDTETFAGIPLGTTCTVAEVSRPDPVPGYEYGEPVLDPENGTVTVDSTTEPVTVTVENPLVWLPAASASIVNDCESGGAVVTLRNDGGGDVVFQIVVDGENFGPTHTVGSEGEETVLVPLDEDQEATIAVEAAGSGTVVEEVVVQDCQNPSAAFAVECAEDGVVVTLTNDGESPAELTVTKDGEVVDTVSVGDTPVDVLVPMDEDETATIAVANGDVPVDEQEVIFDCQPPDANPPARVPTAEVLGTQESPLPRTGSNVFGMVALAAGLILAGATLLGVTRRRS